MLRQHYWPCWLPRRSVKIRFQDYVAELLVSQSSLADQVWSLWQLQPYLEALWFAMCVYPMCDWFVLDFTHLGSPLPQPPAACILMAAHQ
jgi:hypothetical protein